MAAEPLTSAVQTFGPHGPLHRCSIVGQYLFLSVTLNTFDVPVPGSREAAPARPRP